MNIFVIDAPTDEAFLDIMEAASFYSDILLTKTEAKPINLTIKFNSDLNCMAFCQINTTKAFDIEIRNASGDDDPCRSLAHEMVHLKQYVRKEIAEIPGVVKKKETLLWMGEIWSPKKNEDHYFDSPWEVEAFGKEITLFHRWLQIKGEI